MFLRTLMGVFFGLVLFTGLAMAQDGIYLNAAEGDASKVFDEMVNDKLGELGFVVSDAYEHVEDSYASKYGSSSKKAYDKNYAETLDNLGFFAISHDESLRSLLLREPRLGAFSPFNLLIYKYKDEDLTRVGHVNPEVMLDIVGVSDEGVRRDFVKHFDDLDLLINKEIGGKQEVLAFDKLPTKTLMEFEFKFERTKDIIDIVEDFQERFEAVIEDNDYIIAGFKSFSETYADRGEAFDRYETYFVYSLCHFRFSYGIFNHGNAQAGAFAPCSMYMYVEKGSNVIKIGMPVIENWISVAGVKDAEQVKSIRLLDKEIKDMMASLGATLKQ